MASKNPSKNVKRPCEVNLGASTSSNPCPPPSPVRMAPKPSPLQILGRRLVHELSSNGSVPTSALWEAVVMHPVPTHSPLTLTFNNCPDLKIIFNGNVAMEPPKKRC